MEITAPIGLRDKKRAETRAKLERAAVELVLRDGLTHATVDAISEAADVSSRTFFNYFDSKEDAILGVRDIELTDEVVAAHRAEFDGADIVESVVRLLVRIIGPSVTESDLHASRMKVVKAHPELLSRHVSQMMRISHELTAVIQTLLENDPAFAGDDPSSLAPAADILFTLCTGAVRVAVSEWVTIGSTNPTNHIELRAIELVREVTRRIQ